MKALRFDRIGSLDALVLAEVPRPPAVSGEVVVRIHAAGVNPSDFKNVLGKFPYTTVPRTPGRDFAGVVVDGPAGLLGQEVWGSGRELGFVRDGSHAEYLALPAAGVARKPATLSFAEAAASGVPYLTAWEAVERIGVGADTSLVLIGMGAVGTAAYLLATARGADVVVGVRRSEHAGELRARGIEAIVLDDTEKFAAQVRDRFADGAQAVFDTTGCWLPAAITALGTGGHTSVIATPPESHKHVPVLYLSHPRGTLLG
ncbi:zinc-binding alcohol dehydrogenase family protein, partial [Nocardia sp. NPDC060256]|uniref:quinone oxidoreductase family protein n=1 Tax=Nocardia sp. NPDC060256 TaxID=3347086 RepID=UPI003657DC40